MRFVTLLAFGIWAGLAFLIYDMKYDAQRLQNRAATLTRAIQEEQTNLAVARAEWSHLTRPEHVEKLARAVLKFEPVKPEQMVRWNEASDRTAARTPPASTPPTRATSDGIAALIGRAVKKSSLEANGVSR